MQPQDLIRAAAAILKGGHWCQGEPGRTEAIHARDHNGAPVPLFGGTAGDTSRASVNPAAVKFSIYGALVKAQADGGHGSHTGLMWDVLMRLARTEMGGATYAPGGTGYVHPILGYNEAPDRTEAHVLAFLEVCAKTIEVDPCYGAVKTVATDDKGGTLTQFVPS